MLLKIVNTHPRFYWLPNHLETLFVEIWYPMTIASTSRIQKLMIMAAMKLTSGFKFFSPNIIGLLDFGFRGCASLELPP